MHNEPYNTRSIIYKFKTKQINLAIKEISDKKPALYLNNNNNNNNIQPTSYSAITSLGQSPFLSEIKHCLISDTEPIFFIFFFILPSTRQTAQQTIG